MNDAPAESQGNATPSSRLDSLIDRALLLDLETDRQGVAIHKIGALRRGRVFKRQGELQIDRVLAELDVFAGDAAFVVGHNLLGHDLPLLRVLAPALNILGRPIVDTLFISPLAFPENPYHHLIKNYKPVRDSISDPVADCRLADRLLREQVAQFGEQAEQDADLLSVYRFCFQGATLLEGNATGGDGIAEVFRLFSAPLPSVREVLSALLVRWAGIVCTSVAPRLILDHLADRKLRPVLAYGAAWLSVAGANSVLPPWVRNRFPATVPLLKALRDRACDDPDCIWCSTVHDPGKQLAHWFGFDAFRAEPAAADGGSLQRDIVRDGLAERSLLAILPTGGGKSLCFQLPALVRSLRRGTLTVVVSPLQALMKDQVDNLVAKTGTTSSAAIYGLLTPPERGDVMERVRLGDIAILYISPEQLRNRSVAELLTAREIGCWVFDEAHCLSKWGHDFRPDYLYAGRFIRELAARQRVEPPPVTCFTATAKLDVIAEIIDFFDKELGRTLTLFEGGVERDNLHFEVQTVGKHEKDARLHEILTVHLRDGGGAVVYASRRRRTEELAESLAREGWAVEAFHAGLPAPEKKRVQEAFINGELRVICATNAFGMGVDKEDVRVVIHADIPGSLENYIQEAGRAGRDREQAACVLLYDPRDVETQFGLSSLSELTRRDIAEILRGLRRIKNRRGDAVVATSGELLRDQDLRLGFDNEARDADTRVRIAVSWLERAGLVQREQNETRVFQGRPMVATLTEAERKMAGLKLSAEQRARWLSVMEAILNSDPDDGLSADDLARLPAFERVEEAGGRPVFDQGETPAQRVLRTLHDMAGIGLLKKGPQLTAFVRHKVRSHSMLILQRVARLERALLAALREQAPDVELNEELTLSLPQLNQHLLDRGEDSNPETLRDLLKGLSLDGRGMAGASGSLVIGPDGRDRYRVKLQRGWPTLIETAELRQAVAGIVLETLLAKLPTDAPAARDLLVSFGTDELAAALAADTSMGGRIKDPLAAIDRALMFLHEHQAIILHQGLAVFRSAMIVTLPPEAKRKQYTKAQHWPLTQHYSERTFQIHVMDEYARLGAAKISEALALVMDYFEKGKAAFVRRWFADRREMLKRATTAESFRRIVESLGNPAQLEIVAAEEDGNRLVLAGPGSGKTRVIVHRCAYLLRVKRVPSRSILVLCFNRSAALELRRRLVALVGNDARGVTVQTYHGFAMRLTGHSFAERIASAGDEGPSFDGLIAEAVALLEGRVDLPGVDGDRLRDRLLTGFRHILVDEYQDIDADQYRLVSAIAGRTGVDEEAKLTLLAVGDDDQNIYAFRHTSVEFIRRFERDYHAELHYLVENYRSSAHIVDAANALIGRNAERMKTEQPVRIDRRRRDVPSGGRWQELDPIGRGRVLVLEVEDEARQALALGERIRELERIGSHQWSDFAVLARSHEVLEPIRAVLEHEGIPLAWHGDVPPLHRVREIDGFLRGLKERGRQSLSPDDLIALVPEQQSIWRGVAIGLIEDWRAEAGESLVSAARIAEFCYETLAEQRRDQVVGDGVLLSTLHGAKGMEFSHVLIADGGWSHKQQAADEERRVFYVGMTRARETLTLMEIHGGDHPHRRSIEGDWLMAIQPRVATPAPDIVARRYTQLTLADLDLDFAGRCAADARIHGHLAALSAGDSLDCGIHDGRVSLLDRQGNPVARLSGAAAAEWGPRLGCIDRVRILAMLRRDRRQSKSGFSERCRAEQWEVPLAEIQWR